MATFTINGDFADLVPTGVARYGHEVARALAALAAERHEAFAGLDLVLVVRRGTQVPFPVEAIRVREAPDLPRRVPLFWVQCVLPRHVEGGLLSLCNLGPLTVRRQILCIHDLHPLVHPEGYSRAYRAMYGGMVRRLGRRVAHVTTVSAFSRDLIVRHGIAPAGRVSVAYNGHEHLLRDRPAQAARESPGGRRYVLAIGRDFPHKNTGLVFEMAPRLAAEGIEVIVAGAFDPAAVLPAGARIPDNVTLAGRVSDAELAALYRDALCFVFPSRIEGFGLPAVEAMAAGCPLVVADRPCLPEVCGEAALVVGPDDVAGWAAAVLSIASDPQLAARLREAGRRRLAVYSWRSVALHYAGVMRRMAGLPALPAPVRDPPSAGA